jgi:hypothetical protein
LGIGGLAQKLRRRAPADAKHGKRGELFAAGERTERLVEDLERGGFGGVDGFVEALSARG